MIIDAHCHLNFSDFNNNLSDVIDNATKNAIKSIITSGTDIHSSNESIIISNRYDMVYATVGIHPHEADKVENSYVEKLTKMAKENKKVVAIGEIGLDYHYDFSSKENQRKLFKKQIEIALDLNLPIVVHSRSADREAFEIVKQYEVDKALFHCYTGDIETAKEIVSKGYYIGVTGISTFKNRSNAELIAQLSPESLLTETDSPFLAPTPFRGKRNEPAFVKYVLKELCTLFPLYSEDKISKIINDNCRKLFSI